MARFDRIFQNDGDGAKKAEPHPRRETKWIHYTKLTDNAAQYCNERDHSEIEVLAGLIDADKSVLQNLLVRKIDTDEYEIIAGHKRRRACKFLVEEEGKKQYEFLPCTVENISDVQAEFQLYSSNGFHEKNDYEKMHELERMRYLLENYPEEFPHLQTGRMVDRLAKQTHMKRSTVGEYLSISNNLGEKGRMEFAKGILKKSAAVELSGLPEEEQEELLQKGMTAHKDIRQYKEAKREKEEPEDPGQMPVPEQKLNQNPGPEQNPESERNPGTEQMPESNIKPGPNTELKQDTEPETNMEPNQDTEPEGNLELNQDTEPEPNTEPRQGTEPETDMEPSQDTDTEPEPNMEPKQDTDTEPGVNTEPEPIAEPGQIGKPVQSENDPSRTEELEQVADQAVDQEPDEQLPGQYKVINTDMKIVEDVPISKEEETEEDVPNFGTQGLEEMAKKYTPRYFLEEQKEKLDAFIREKEAGQLVPEKALERQKTLVCALAAMATDLENGSSLTEQDTAQPELPQMRNDAQRKEWLHNYEAWGIWYRDEHIGAVYYKYDFSDGTRLIAEAYPGKYPSPFLHLVGGPEERERNTYGQEKYPYHESYSRHPDCDGDLVEFLKAIQRK